MEVWLGGDKPGAVVMEAVAMEGLVAAEVVLLEALGEKLAVREGRMVAVASTVAGSVATRAAHAPPWPERGGQRRTDHTG